jgi:hypothetical protein
MQSRKLKKKRRLSIPTAKAALQAMLEDWRVAISILERLA